MKKKILVLCLIAFLCLPFTLGFTAGDKDSKCQKFIASYTIRFNSVTLLEASRIEKRLMAENPDACQFDIKLERAPILTPYLIISEN